MDNSKANKYQVLIILNSSSKFDSLGSLDKLINNLNSHDTYVVKTSSLAEAEDKIRKDYDLGAVLIEDSLFNGESSQAIHNLLILIGGTGNGLPVFLVLNQPEASTVPVTLSYRIHETINLNEDTTDFISGRINYAIKHYIANLLPPYFKALKNFAEDSPYYWDCPGHQGGVAYLKNRVGKEFIKFFGENLMRADIGIATPDLGDWLEHKGPPADSEAAAARIFGADMTFYVTAGSSQSNQIVGHGVLTANTVAVVDRNCHKSVNHELNITRTRPVYFKPERNGLGIIGLIPPNQFKADHIKHLIKKSPLVEKGDDKASYAVVTNCTYDGIIYDINTTTKLLADSVPRIKYDEAWYAYAKFHPLYEGRFGMGVPSDMPNRPTIFAVQSTHKMLAAFSSASMIHIKNSSRAPVDKEIFNQSFQMHGTTSPFYPIIASTDIATAMMDGEGGKHLVHEALTDALSFRKTLARVSNESELRKEWSFGVWQPKSLSVKGSAPVPFENIPVDELLSSSSYWELKPNDSWHGFKHIVDGYAMLDPLKVTITCPGASATGENSEFGIPAPIVCQFMNAQRIIQARNGDYNILILFALGSTRGKWATLIDVLLEFKRLHDSDASVEQALPELVSQHSVYQSMTLKELCASMHKTNLQYDLANLAGKACDAVAMPVYSPYDAYQALIGGNTEKIKVKDIMNRAVGVMITPYPPGIPVLMPGEKITEDSKAILEYLLAMQELDKKFPGFSHELQGIEVDETGEYWVRCIKE